MEALAWVCLFAPLAGVVVLTLAGSRISRQVAAWAGTAFAFASFAAAVGDVRGDARRERLPARAHLHPLHLGRVGRVQGAAGDARRPAVGDRDADRGRRRRRHRHVLDRVHARRPEGAPLLRLPRPVPVLDAAARHGGELRAAPGGLGARGPVVVPPDRVLARASRARRRREEGVRDERDRRRRHRHRDLLHGARPGHDELLDGVPYRLPALGRRARPTPTGSPRGCWSGRSPSRPSSRCKPGFPTRWRARRRSRP